MDGIPNLDTYCHIGSQRLHSILKNTAQTCIACKVLQQKKEEIISRMSYNFPYFFKPLNAHWLYFLKKKMHYSLSCMLETENTVLIVPAVLTLF